MNICAITDNNMVIQVGLLLFLDNCYWKESDASSFLQLHPQKTCHWHCNHQIEVSVYMYRDMYTVEPV